MGLVVKSQAIGGGRRLGLQHEGRPHRPARGFSNAPGLQMIARLQWKLLGGRQGYCWAQPQSVG